MMTIIYLHATMRRATAFAPVEPDMMVPMNMQVVGARYTTLEGVIAAQILYLDPNGEPCTLYLARPVEKLAQVPAGEHAVDGLRVSVWAGKGSVDGSGAAGGVVFAACPSCRRANPVEVIRHE